MINKIKRKLSVQKFANGGIGTIPIMPGLGGSGTVGMGGAVGARIPASVGTMGGFTQAAMSAWPKIKTAGSLGLNTPEEEWRG